jgi:CheY-like chemotaxis protein
MQDHGYAWLQLKTILRLLVCCGLAFIGLLSFSPAQATAHAEDTPARNLTLQLDVGFNSFYRIGYWTPIRVTLSNEGADFRGTLAINTFSGLSLINGGSNTSPWSFEEPVTLPQGTQKKLTLTMPLYMGLFPPHGITARLLDTHGHAVATQQATPQYLNPGDMLVGIFSDNYAGFSSLSAVTLPNGNSSVALAPLDAATMPTMTMALSNFDVIVLDILLPDANGLDLLEKFLGTIPDVEVILITGHGSIDGASEAMKMGAYDYVTKPFSLDRLELIIEKAFERVCLQREDRLLRHT